MKTTLLLFLLAYLSPRISQAPYPVPPESPLRLFYIQHSQNTNTYVYDANMDGKTLDPKDPIDIYRILYAEGGKKMPLNGFQRKLAYGVTTKSVGPNRFEFSLVSFPGKKFYLKMHQGRPMVTVTVNGTEMHLRNIFLSTSANGGVLKTEVKYADFHGTSIKTGAEVKERFYPPKK